MSNKVKCLLCKDVIESKTRHDFQCCTCGNVCVDGGEDYKRRVYRDMTQVEELEDALKSVPHAQSHISKLERELAELKEDLNKHLSGE